jgi:hypothetical protein
MQTRYSIHALAAAAVVLVTLPPSGNAEQAKTMPGAAKPARALQSASHPKEPAGAARKQPSATLKAPGVLPGPGIGPVVQSPTLAHCAVGFNKTDENKDINGGLQAFECTTPVIACPSNPVYPNASLEVEIISNNPEQAAKQIRYTCTYYPAVP